MNVRGSLYAKLLLWLALNLLLIAGLFLLLPGRGGQGWNILLSQPVRERMLNIGDRLAADLSQAPARRNEVLSSYASEYGVSFALDDAGGPLIMRAFGPGPPVAGGPPFPPSPSGPMLDSGGLPFLPPQSTPVPDRAAPLPLPGAAGALIRFQQPFRDRQFRAGLINIARLHAFGGYEISMPITLEGGAGPPRPVTLHLHARGFGRLLRLLGVTDWMMFALLVILLSAALWWPFIWSITRTVAQLTAVAGEISAGRFEARVHSRRRDELGRLAEAVNRMAGRLQNFVSGQRQFLADVAHEVASPLARLQIGLGLLELHAADDARRVLDEVQEEAQQMTQLLQELLLYSRVDLAPQRAPLAAVELEPLVDEVLRREDLGHRVRLDLEPGIRAMAEPALLRRALANLVRNALRYAADAEVEVGAVSDEQGVRLTVRDRGPGVPEEALPRLGEPFYRPQLARERDSGGSGLGLAIVRRAVDACGGRVSWSNRAGGGFAAEIRLARAAAVL
ncbi:MAG: HAMP domain-containing sensor histidine kinase [Nevskia sp.]|nr:HAMP domain-containing sensor histidine kinase [Nevskia sp.]